MKKLRLDLDALAVDTFDPAPPEDGQGTVLGEQWGPTQLTCGYICGTNLCLTRDRSCYGTCTVSCHLTCVTCGVTGINTCIVCDTYRATCYTCASCPTVCLTHCDPQCLTPWNCPPTVTCGR